MIPDSFATVLAFLLLIAPGTVWELQRARHKPESKRTALQEVSQIVLASLLASGAAAISLWLPWSVLVLLPVLGSEPGTVPMVQVIVLASGTSALGCAYSWLWAFLTWGRLSPIKDSPVWHQALAIWGTAPTTPPLLRIELTNGAVWKGRYKAMGAGVEDTERLIALAAPLAYRASPPEEFISRDFTGTVLLKSSDAISIEVFYLSEEQ